MQALIELPRWNDIEAGGGPEEVLFRPVCGVPLLARVIRYALRDGHAPSLFIAHPPELAGTWLRERLNRCLPPAVSAQVRIVEDDSARTLAAAFERRQARLPWDAIAGIHVDSPRAAARAERELVRRSGKATDGMYSKFNRRLCRPAVRWFSYTAITPNMVSVAGLMICLLSAIAFTGGHWSAYAAGGALFFIAGLCDEIDGMLARVTFRESAFGCWLESLADQAGYLLVFGGMTIGLYRQRGALWLFLGSLFVFGCLMSVLVTSGQRKRATSADRPQDYLPCYYKRLEADSGNWISRRVRQVQFVMKKSAIMHHILIFSLLGLLPFLVAMGALAANLIWILALYFDRRFFRPQKVTVWRRCSEAH